MKIYETQLNTNQYTAVKSIHCETKPTYKGEMYRDKLKQELKQDKKFHITKKCEILKQNEVEKVEQVAENSVKINKSVSLEDLFKKFNTK